jgi:hypothetical protein
MGGNLGSCFWAIPFFNQKLTPSPLVLSLVACSNLKTGIGRFAWLGICQILASNCSDRNIFVGERENTVFQVI